MSARAQPRGLLPIGIAALCVAGVAAALVSQHVFDMQPCPWCVLQRLIFVVIAALALLIAVWPSSAARRAGGAVIVLLAVAGAAASAVMTNSARLQNA